MDNTAYVALSQQRVLRRQMDVIANNLANVDTAGFKLDTLLTRTERARPAGNMDAPNPVSFVLDAGLGRDFSQGQLRRTSGPLDFGLEGDGFFTVRTPQGDRYTRDGGFSLDAGGRLVTSEGHAVLDDAGGEITLNPTVGEVTVAPDGSLSQGGQAVGRLGVARFANQGVLQKIGDNLYQAPADAQPVQAADTRVRQGWLEASNVQPIVQITDMIEVQRAYERISKIVDSAHSLSRSAVERLGRVN